MTMNVSNLLFSRKERNFSVKQFDVSAHELAIYVVAESDFYNPHKTTVEFTISSGAMYSHASLMPDVAREFATALLESAAEAERIAAEVAQ